MRTLQAAYPAFWSSLRDQKLGDLLDMRVWVHPLPRQIMEKDPRIEEWATTAAPDFEATLQNGDSASTGKADPGFATPRGVWPARRGKWGDPCHGPGSAERERVCWKPHPRGTGYRQGCQEPGPRGRWRLSHRTGEEGSVDRGAPRRRGAFPAGGRGGEPHKRGGRFPLCTPRRMSDEPEATGREDGEELGAGWRLRGERGGRALDGEQSLQWEGPPLTEGKPPSGGRRG